VESSSPASALNPAVPKRGVKAGGFAWAADAAATRAVTDWSAPLSPVMVLARPVVTVPRRLTGWRRGRLVGGRMVRSGWAAWGGRNDGGVETYVRAFCEPSRPLLLLPSFTPRVPCVLFSTSFHFGVGRVRGQLYTHSSTIPEGVWHPPPPPLPSPPTPTFFKHTHTKPTHHTSPRGEGLARAPHSSHPHTTRAHREYSLMRTRLIMRGLPMRDWHKVRRRRGHQNGTLSPGALNTTPALSIFGI